jgi:hypothetical protein
LICVAGFVAQSDPATAIFDPGNACGIPYAPDDGLEAKWFHPDSRVHNASRHDH